MIKISHRDVFALFGDEFAQEYESNVAEEAVEFEEYTPDVIGYFKNKFESGDIESFPVKIDTSIIWKKRNGVPHREGDKAAVISSDGDEHYYLDGKLHRDNAPAIFNRANSRGMSWYLHGRKISSIAVSTGSQYIGASNRYKIEVERAFPSVDKIWLWDYFDDIAPELIKIFKQNHPDWF